MIKFSCRVQLYILKIIINQIEIYTLLLIKKVGNAWPEDSDLHYVSSKTQYQFEDYCHTIPTHENKDEKVKIIEDEKM